MRNASAAEAPAAKLRNERRDAKGTLKSLSWGAITHLVPAILQQNRGQVCPRPGQGPRFVLTFIPRFDRRKSDRRKLTGKNSIPRSSQEAHRETSTRSADHLYSTRSCGFSSRHPAGREIGRASC